MNLALWKSAEYLCWYGTTVYMYAIMKTVGYPRFRLGTSGRLFLDLVDFWVIITSKNIKQKRKIVNLELIKTWLDRPQSSFSRNGWSEIFFLKNIFFMYFQNFQKSEFWFRILILDWFYQKFSNFPNLANRQFFEFRQNFQSPQTCPTINFSNFCKNFIKNFRIWRSWHDSNTSREDNWRRWEKW